MRLAILAAFLGTTALMPLSALAQQQTPAPQPNSNPQQQGQQPTAQRQAGQPQNQQGQQGQGPTAAQLQNQTLHTQSDQQVGRVERLVQDRNNRTFAVVASDDGPVLVPSERIAWRDNRFVVTGADDKFQAYNQQVAGQYREVDPNVRLVIVGYDVDPILAARRTGQQQTAQGQDGADIVVRQPAPTVRVDPADPRVIVRQQPPQVTVNQQQPEIIVRQPQPTVTVNIPQPEITLRMPQPDVNVALQQPNVQVLMERPDVAVTQPGQPRVQVGQSQPQVFVQRSADLEPNVQVIQSPGQPTVRYERAQPRVIVNQAQGQPNVRFEQQGQPNVNVEQAQQNQPQDRSAYLAAADRAHDQAGLAINERAGGADEARAAGATGAVNATANLRPFRIRDLEDMDVYSLRGQKIGEVKRVVRRIGDNQGFVILEHGGFLGLGEKEVPLPMNRVFMMGNRLVAAGMTEAEVNAARDWDFNGREYREIGDNDTVDISVRG